QVGGGLEREQVLANRSRENDGHVSYLSGVKWEDSRCPNLFRSGDANLEPSPLKRNESKLDSCSAENGINCSHSRALPQKPIDIAAYCATDEKAAGWPRSPTVNYNGKGLRSDRLEKHQRVAGATHSLFNDCAFKKRRRTGMALKVELKPNERIIIGACVVTNTDQRARLLIDGDRIPILREKDILTPETADTPAKLIYLSVQLMYLSPDPMAHHPTYFTLVRDILTTIPSAWPFIEGINNNILNGDLYHALKESKKLIGHEEELIADARSLQAAKSGSEADRKSA
ncbi:MAG TPA: flagellar biosynthesis repressor FlbT, partial [Burkholderiaceae bacterium]|nr:flagellar biosynthesis repressor FlbT [Burkholderiaceae bacterium]